MVMSVQWMIRFVAVRIVVVALIPLTGGSSPAGDDPIWKCDDLTPDLCPLRVEVGTVAIRGIDVTYWTYRRRRDVDNTANDSGANLQYDATLATPESSSSSLPPLWPILMLHGGPGMPHNYMLPLKQQACRGRTVIFYDQAGCGQSAMPSSHDRTKNGTTTAGKPPREEYPWLWDPAYYATEELPALIRHLHLSRYHILANSWGTILAQHFALDYLPTLSHLDDDANPSSTSPLVSMVLSGPLSDGQASMHAQWDPVDGTLGRLPPYVQQRLHATDAAPHNHPSTEYQAITDALTSHFTCRTAPFPDCVSTSFRTMNSDISVGMQGASAMVYGGVLRNVALTGRWSTLLGEYEDGAAHPLPVLLTHGRYDIVRPSIVDTLRTAIPGAESIVLERSGHFTMVDEPGAMNDAVGDFFDRVEAGQWSSSSRSTSEPSSNPPSTRPGEPPRRSTSPPTEHPWSRAPSSVADEAATIDASSPSTHTAPPPPQRRRRVWVHWTTVVSLCVAFAVGYLSGAAESRRYILRLYEALPE